MMRIPDHNTRREGKIPADERETETETDSGDGDGSRDEAGDDQRGPAQRATSPQPAAALKKDLPVKSAVTKQVDRVTALRGPRGEIPRPSKATLRRRTLEDLRVQNPEVPYRKYEEASRDLICALMERQDRITEELLYRIIELECEVRDLQFAMNQRWS